MLLFAVAMMHDHNQFLFVSILKYVPMESKANDKTFWMMKWDLGIDNMTLILHVKPVAFLS